MGTVFAQESQPDSSQPALPGFEADKPRSVEAPQGGAPAQEKAQNKLPQATGSGGMLPEVVIKGQEGENRLGGLKKPAFNIDIDPYETIRPSLAPDQSLLLAMSPLTVSWRRTHPEFLMNERVTQPYRMTFSQRPGIAFRVRDQLSEVLQRRVDPKEAKQYSWNLTIADEEGRVFHRYEGSNNPPEELVWTGQNDQGEWIRAGRSYSAVYTFTDPAGSPRTSVGKPLLFRGIVHQEDTGMHISMDSAILFGSSKANSELTQPGHDLLRSAADLIKRRFSGIPINVRVFASTKELGDMQANAIYDKLLRELMMSPRNITIDAARAPYSDQRVEIILLNR
ncbi:MAG: hypothetical protein HY549_05875 [Elusimicrobia bacterium]|nr:hypothetical protein [Elusimicrobiota bacterium]